MSVDPYTPPPGVTDPLTVAMSTISHQLAEIADLLRGAAESEPEPEPELPQEGICSRCGRYVALALPASQRCHPGAHLFEPEPVLPAPEPEPEPDALPEPKFDLGDAVVVSGSVAFDGAWQVTDRTWIAHTASGVAPYWSYRLDRPGESGETARSEGFALTLQRDHAEVLRGIVRSLDGEP